MGIASPGINGWPPVILFGFGQSEGQILRRHCRVVHHNTNGGRDGLLA